MRNFIMKFLQIFLIFSLTLPKVFPQSPSAVTMPSSDTTLTTKKLIGRLNTTTARSSTGMEESEGASEVTEEGLSGSEMGGATSEETTGEKKNLKCTLKIVRGVH